MSTGDKSSSVFFAEQSQADVAAGSCSADRNPWAASREECRMGVFLLFSTTESMLSKTIRWATRSHISHVALGYHCDTVGRLLVMESAGAGFRILPWEAWEEENTLHHIFQVSVDQAVWQQTLTRFVDVLGMKYDAMRAVVNFVELAGRRFAGLSPTRIIRFPRQHKVLCSDAIAIFFQQMDLPEFRNPSKWTPAEFLAYAEEEELFDPIDSVSLCCTGSQSPPRLDLTLK